MTRAESCIAKAEQCERAALSAQEPNIRDTYRDLARQWRHLAADIEQLKRSQDRLARDGS